MSYDNDKKAFDRTTKKIIAASQGRLSTRQAQNRLRKAIQTQQKHK